MSTSALGDVYKARLVDDVRFDWLSIYPQKSIVALVKGLPKW